MQEPTNELKGSAVTGILVDEATTPRPGLTQALAMAEKSFFPMLSDGNKYLTKYVAEYIGDRKDRAKNKAARKARKAQRKCRK